jgi:hypothetical protein
MARNELLLFFMADKVPLKFSMAYRIFALVYMYRLVYIHMFFNVVVDQ